MSLSTQAAKGLACSGCRQWALRTFISSIGGPSMHFSPPPQRSIPRRAFASHSRRYNEARERIQRAEKGLDDDSFPEPASAEEDAIPEEETKEASSGEQEVIEMATESTTSSSTEAFVPWYLQVEPAIQPQENVLSARQKIPDLPEHPPPMLESLLHHVSVELGMDDLSLLDLRGIDPPPALGANLLMLVGTARSEKHLHYSADKLCRWLRSEHRLTPYADGLLGRQELKLNLKRRAKRSRLMSAVGAKSTADTELDEGIRTGWICVNIGRVEGGELPKTEEQLEREKNIVGFGTGMTGSNVVVQLLTEDKRGEIELERLWMAVLKKRTREREELLAKDESVTIEESTTSTESASQASHYSVETSTQQTYAPMDAPPRPGELTT